MWILLLILILLNITVYNASLTFVDMYLVRTREYNIITLLQVTLRGVGVLYIYRLSDFRLCTMLSPPYHAVNI
jgi:hypothetical protein